MTDSSIVLGYGYRRQKRRLVDAGANRILIDTDDEKFFQKEIRRSMGITLRPGDTLLLISITDLGPRPTHLLKCLAGWNVKVQIAGHEPVLCNTKELRDELIHSRADRPYRDPKRPRGRPPKFNPTPAQAKMIRMVWNTEGVTRAHRLKQVEEIMDMRPGSLKFWLVRDWISKQNEPKQ